MPLESYYVLSPKPCIVLIGVNTRRQASRRAEEEMANVGDQDNQMPPQENQAPQPMTDGNIR